MKTLYLIRHAQSFANAGGKSLPERDIPLSEYGQQQAKLLSNKLPADIFIEQVYVSEMLRTMQTALPYCMQHDIKPTVLPCLNEFSYLSWNLVQGLDSKQRKPISTAYWQRANIHERTGNDVDTFAEFSQRVDSFLEQWQLFPNHSLFFGHGIWIGLLAWKLMGFSCNTTEDMKQFRAFQTALPVPNAGIWRLSGNSPEHLKLAFMPSE